MEVTMYARAQQGVKVEARQKLEAGKYIYTVEGFVNGESVRVEISKGYRDASPDARKMFKELYEAHVPAAGSRPSKVKLTIEEKEAIMIQHMQDKIDRQAKKAEEAEAAKAERKEKAMQEKLAKQEAAAASGEVVVPKKKFSKKVHSTVADAAVEAPQ